MLSEDVVLGAVIIGGGLCLYAACAVGWGFSKEIQPLIDQFFGSDPEQRKPDDPETRRKAE
jgi:hypothetical protein